MIEIKLTEEQSKNLEVFLSRVQLTGAEVRAFQEIVRALVVARERIEIKAVKVGK